MNLTKLVSFTSAAFALAFATTCFATSPDASTPPELQGILVTRQQPRFALISAGGERSGWIGTGDTFAGWKLTSYLANENAIVLTCANRHVTVPLRTSTVRDGDAAPAAKATVAEADELLLKANFDAMWDRIADEQKKGIVASIRQQASGEFKKAGLSGAEIDSVLDKMGDALVAGMQSDAMRQDFAQIYADVYTKDELRGMAAFYDTTAGKAWVEKQPEVQQRLMQVLMPRVMQGMPAAQKIAADYIRQRTAPAK